jgi:uncharacterized protein (TIGR03086 family)
LTDPYETLRIFGHISYGGGDFGEIAVTSQRITAGDYDSRHDEWLATADRVAGERVAEGGAADQRPDGFLRASNYYRAAEFFLHGDATDPRIRHAYEASVACFRQGAALFDPVIEPIEIPYEGTTLPGYLYRVDNSGAQRLTGTDAGAAHEDDWLGDDPQAAYATAAALDRAAWRRQQNLDHTTVRLGFGVVPGPMAALIHLTEVLVHGVDLAIATGQHHLIDEESCAELLAVMRGTDFAALRRPGMFGPAVFPPDDAPAHLRLLAFLGRELAPANTLETS